MTVVYNVMYFELKVTYAVIAYKFIYLKTM